MRRRAAVLCAVGAWLSGCHVLAPLPAVDSGEGGAGSEGGLGAGNEGGLGAGSEGSAEGGDGGAGGSDDPIEPTSTGPCELTACSVHCAQVSAHCDLSPQDPSVQVCCAECEAMPSPEEYAACRLEELYMALAEGGPKREKACHDVLRGERPEQPCEADEDDD